MNNFLPPSNAEPSKESVLYLVHRIPFPPNKGDKIRSFHLLQYLSQRYTVQLACFIDDENDHQYVEKVKEYCGETLFVSIHPTLSKLRSLQALLNGRPLSFEFYRKPQVHEWVAATINKHSIKKAVVFSSAMAQFIDECEVPCKIIDFVDVDSDKWQQYAEKKSWPMSALYRREAKTVLDQENQIARKFNQSFFVSEAEADLFRTLAPKNKKKISYFNNGVDSDYFAPRPDYANPFAKHTKNIVFTGAMDYWPNVDAVQWFVSEVFNKLQEQNQQLNFYIVGSRPTQTVQALAQNKNITVTGMVPDVRPYLAFADIVIAPLRIARGIQNKVLEAMAMAKVVVVSPQALEGIDAIDGEELILANGAQSFIEKISGLLRHPPTTIGVNARAKVVGRYNWESNLNIIGQALDLKSK